MEENEVIAVKSRTFLVLGIILMILFPFVFWYLYIEHGNVFSGGYPVILLLLTVVLYALVSACLIYVIYLLVVYFRTPYILIEKRGDNIVAFGKTFAVSQISDVQYRRIGRYGNFYRSGRIKIFLRDGTFIKCQFVADVENVHAKLFALICQADKQREDN